MLEKADTVPTLVGLKFTNNDLAVGAGCVKVAGGKYAVFLGSNTTLAAAMTLGFDSAITSSLNMLPKENMSILTAFQRGDIKTASEAQSVLGAVIGAISKHGPLFQSFNSLKKFSL